MGVTHATTTAISDDPSYDISSGEWNATHSFDGQLAFPATQNPSADANTLDDYEEGSYTPVLTFSTPGNLAVTYAAQSGQYVKIGRLVIVRGRIQTSAFTHTTASGNCRVTGLPFTPQTSHQGALSITGYTNASYTMVVAEAAGGQTYFQLYASGSGQALRYLAVADLPTGGTVELNWTIPFQV